MNSYVKKKAYKEDKMSKLLSISLAVLLALLFVSCSPETNAVDDNLAIISFSTGVGSVVLKRQTRHLARMDFIGSTRPKRQMKPGSKQVKQAQRLL